MADTVYVVCRKGVNYRHELAGVFSGLECAIGVAAECISHEPDDYHTYEIVALPFGHMPTLVRAARLCEPFAERIPPVAVVYREGNHVLTTRSATPIPW